MYVTKNVLASHRSENL